MKEDWFVEKVKKRWTELQINNVLSGCIEDEYTYLNEYEADLTINKSNAVKRAKNLLKWIENRIEWLDEEWLLTD